jgi:LysR family transcriptional regulator, hypochlorite-specific transcription factor HypT
MGIGDCVDTSWLADLQALAETLNFSRAAELRNITQPAFGRRIRSLEDWCGMSLVDRSTHRLKLTAAGEIMLGTADDVTRRLERARRELEQSRAASAVLTFAATHALSFQFFPGWIQALGPAASTMPIRLLSDNMDECERIMLDRRSQFLLCHHAPDVEGKLPARDFRHIELATDRLIPVTGKDLAGEPLHRLPGTPQKPVAGIAFDATSGMGRILRSSLTRWGDELHMETVFTSDLAMVLKALACDGKGVAWIPESLAADEMGPDGRLIRAGGEQWAIDVKVSLFRPRARMAEMAETFWEMAAEGRS